MSNHGQAWLQNRVTILTGFDSLGLSWPAGGALEQPLTQQKQGSGLRTGSPTFCSKLLGTAALGAGVHPSGTFQAMARTFPAMADALQAKAAGALSLTRLQCSMRSLARQLPAAVRGSWLVGIVLACLHVVQGPAMSSANVRSGEPVGCKPAPLFAAGWLPPSSMSMSCSARILVC